jgi:hypothetical protein
MFDGPIAGENYTSDTRNYAWHRPPELNTYDEGVEFFIKRLSDPEKMSFYTSSMASGLSILDLTTHAMLQMVQDGIVTVDVGILVCGPIAKSLEMLAEKQEITFEKGWKDTPTIMTPAIMKSMMAAENEEGPEREVLNMLEEDVEEAPVGIMAVDDDFVASTEEQEAMMGVAQEDEEAA